MPKIEKLPCALTEKERLEFSDKLESEIAAQSNLEVEMEAIKKTYKRKSEVSADKILELRDILRTRTEYRDVEVTERADFKRSVVDVYRQDTFELVRTRPLAKEERQSPLFREQNSETIDGETKAEKSIGKRSKKKDEDEQRAEG